MKKLTSKFRKKNQQDVTQKPSSLRITNETVAEHREKVLAGGRKFKYPMQYTKHRIVIVTSLLVFSAIVAFFGFFTWELYAQQNTGEFTYRLTQVFPYPVAKVDGNFVAYSDYLLGLRSAVHYLTTKEGVSFSSQDGQRQLAYQKRLALNRAIDNTYAAELTNSLHVSVSESEVNSFIQQSVDSTKLGISQAGYKQIISDYYGWSFDEYKHTIYQQLLLQKVLAAYDLTGRENAQNYVKAINQGMDFTAAAKAWSQDPSAKANGGDVGVISKNSNDPSGLIKVAQTLAPGQVSGVIDGIDGFYIIKLLDKQADSVHFARIFIRYSGFSDQISKLRHEGKIKEYISIPQVAGLPNL